MNPHMYPGEPGWREDACNEEGASYLRRLKGAVDVPIDAGATPSSKVAAAMESLGLKERRKVSRIRCSGGVEFQAEGSEVRMWGTLTDISLHGCYVEMSNSFPVGTKVDLVLKSCGIRIETPGTVRASYPALGMGIALREIAAEQEGHLKQLIAFLGGHNSASHGGPVAETREKEENNVRNAMATADPKALFDEIQQFFQKNYFLSRDEFHEIARRVGRS